MRSMHGAKMNFRYNGPFKIIIIYFIFRSCISKHVHCIMAFFYPRIPFVLFAEMSPTRFYFPSGVS